MKNQKSSETQIYDICVIGGGIIGASISRELSQYDKTVITLEANSKVAMETTAGNSGLVHGGFDPTSAKLNAKLNILGKKRYEDWIKTMEFPYKRINSTVVAFNKKETEAIHLLYKRGIKNGLKAKEMEIIDQKELNKREPNISKEVLGAFVCNSSIAVDTVELTKVLFENAIKNGNDLRVNSKVIEIRKENKSFLIKTSKKEKIKAKVIINAAGHYADVISKMAGYPDFDLTTRRGEYLILEKDESNVVNSVIFMVPTIYGKGVVVAPMLDGHLMVGPTANDGVDKKDTRLITKKSFDTIGEIGRKIIPKLKIERTCMMFSGSRPIYSITDDFYIQPAQQDSYFINVAGIKSPGIAAAPAIADYVIEIVRKLFLEFNHKKSWNPIQKSILPLN